MHIHVSANFRVHLLLDECELDECMGGACKQFNEPDLYAFIIVSNVC